MDVFHILTLLSTGKIETMNICPHCNKKIDEHNKYLEKFIDILFALILGSSVFMFSKAFQLDSFSLDLDDIGKTLLFISAIFVVIYDWFAYHILIKKLPYKKEWYFVRFLVDLIIFYMMYLLFIAVTKSVEFYVKVIGFLFLFVLIWHLLAYRQFRKTPKKDICKSGIKSSGIACIIFYSVYYYIIRSQELFGDAVMPLINIFVALIVGGYCSWRFKSLLKNGYS